MISNHQVLCLNMAIVKIGLYPGTADHNENKYCLRHHLYCGVLGPHRVFLELIFRGLCWEHD